MRLPTHFDLFTPSHCILLLYRLVEEFMLLANMAVAHKTHKTFPQKALLRRHPPPKSKMMEDLVNSFTIKELISFLCLKKGLLMSACQNLCCRNIEFWQVLASTCSAEQASVSFSTKLLQKYFV